MGIVVICSYIFMFCLGFIAGEFSFRKRTERNLKDLFDEYKSRFKK